MIRNSDGKLREYTSGFVLILNDVKTKLNLQKEQRELYEKQHYELMDILNLSSEKRSVPGILKAIRNLKDYVDQNETEHYSNAREIINHHQSEQSV